VTILSQYMSPIGREIKIIIDHASRNINIVEGSIRSHVLQTTILAFQQHRLHSPYSQPVLPTPAPLRQHVSTGKRVSTGKECSICYDLIYQHNMAALPCAHMFHQPCIQQWLNQKQTCPVCRNHV
jgi:hypothetical protein